VSVHIVRCCSAANPPHYVQSSVRGDPISGIIETDTAPHKYSSSSTYRVRVYARVYIRYNNFSTKFTSFCTFRRFFFFSFRCFGVFVHRILRVSLAERKKNHYLQRTSASFARRLPKAILYSSPESQNDFASVLLLRAMTLKSTSIQWVRDFNYTRKVCWLSVRNFYSGLKLISCVRSHFE